MCSQGDVIKVAQQGGPLAENSLVRPQSLVARKEAPAPCGLQSYFHQARDTGSPAKSNNVVNPGVSVIVSISYHSNSRS
jgi:hypothetical protein